jgi:hypothetical protein
MNAARIIAERKCEWDKECNKIHRHFDLIIND